MLVEEIGEDVTGRVRVRPYEVPRLPLLSVISQGGLENELGGEQNWSVSSKGFPPKNLYVLELCY